MDRRQFLATAGTAALATLAGCGGTDNESTPADTGGTTDDTNDGMGGTTTDGGMDGMSADIGPNVPDHEATAGVLAQPRLGNFEGHTVVAFEDPSCPRCRAFEKQVVPEIRSKLVEGGSTTFVARGYPVVYPWGDPAAKALEATYTRDAGAFWSLWEHYYDAQSEFSTDNVLDRTASFLSSETGLDGDSVVAAVENGDADPAVQTDLDAGMAAGAGRTTPSVFVFADGEYVTKVQGSPSYRVIATALGER
jgi:protein-disulfide isomerase